MSLIAELQREPGLFAQCPSCGDDFRLKNAVLFDATKRALPQAAQDYLNVRRRDIANQRTDLESQKVLAKERAQVGAEAVNIGQVVEKIAPSLPGFPVVSSDCRSLFEPIDYLVFSGLSDRGEIDSLMFVDVKSGNARLSGHQSQIKRLVECGEVRFTVAERPEVP